MKKIANVTLAVLMSLVTACAGTQAAAPAYVAPRYLDVGDGAVLTPNTEIVDEAGAFHLKAGEPWRAPFSNGMDCVLAPEASDSNAGQLSGARRVRVKVPQLEEPLYGLLSLCGTPEGATGPASRLYHLEVPAEFVENTAGGLVSVVFESHQGHGDSPPKSWILWLSRTPFPPPDATKSAPFTSASAARAAEARATADAEEAARLAAESQTEEYMMYGGLALFAVAAVGLAVYLPSEDGPFGDKDGDGLSNIND